MTMGKNKKVLCRFKYELAGKTITEFVGLRPKTYSYLIDDFQEKQRNKEVCSKKKT